MNKNYDILFLSGLFPKEKENEIIKNSKGVIQNAANALQWNLVKGFDENKTSIQILNSLYIGAFPLRYKKPFIKTYKFAHNKNAKNDINTGFINLPGYKHISRFNNMKKYLKNWALNGQKDKAVVAYALTSIFIRAFKYIKKINPDIKTIMIVPDLPEFMNTTDRSSILYRILKSHDMKFINKNLSFCDGFVLLTEQMSNVLKCKNYTVVEGIAPEYENTLTSKFKNKTILYTGTLNRRYGVMNLVNAFRMIKNTDYSLIICGAGDSEQEIINASKEDSRIVFKGQIARSEVLNLQAKARLLVNPRQNNEEFTKYSFPSKNLEYLASGTPLAAFKLDGIPKEYDDYIFYINDSNKDAMSNYLYKICEKDDNELFEFAQKARSFVLNSKNAKVQVKKILDLIERV